MSHADVRKEGAHVGTRWFPRDLELLVPGRSTRPLAQAPVRVGMRPLSGFSPLVTLPAVATILLCGVDLFFRGKLEALLPGHHFITADSVEPPDLVIADIARIDADDVAESYPDVPILGFTSHTDTAGLRAAQSAGFDHVLVKSALQERASQIVEELVR